MPNILNQLFQRVIRWKTYMSVLAGANHVAGNPIKDHSQGFDFMVMNIIRHNASLEKVLQVVGQHLDKQKQLIAFLVLLAVLVKRKSFLKIINVVLDIATLIVVMEDLFRCQIVNISHNGLIFILEPITVQIKLSIRDIWQFLAY